MTHDSESPNVPVLVTGTIQGTITATPTMLAMGHSAPEGAKGRYLVKGSRPFAIKTLEGSGDGFTIAADDAKSKTLHILTVTYDPRTSNMCGDLRRSFKLTTDLADEAPIELNATLHIDP